MTRERRKELVEQLEQLRGSKVLAYVTSDRKPASGQIGDDAVRPLYDHLRQMGHVKKLDLFVYSTGGAIDVPWRIVTALRTTADEWQVLIPFRANQGRSCQLRGQAKWRHWNGEDGINRPEFALRARTGQRVR